MGTENINNVDISKILGKEKIEDIVVTSAASKRVVSDPLPGPMLDAVANQECEVKTSKGLVILRPVVMYDFTIFKKINSPHYRTMIEAENEREIELLDIQDEELYEMIYQFTHSCKETRILLKQSRDIFREAAIEEIAEKYEMGDLKSLLEGVAIQIQKGFSTMMAHEPSSDKDTTDPLDGEIKKKQS